MHSRTLVAVLLAAATCLVEAHGDRPKIYFPRHIKRAYTNKTETRTEPFVGLQTPPQTSRRQSSTDVLTATDSPVFVLPDPPITTGTSSPPEPSGVGSSSESTSSGSSSSESSSSDTSSSQSSSATGSSTRSAGSLVAGPETSTVVIMTTVDAPATTSSTGGLGAILSGLIPDTPLTILSPLLNQSPSSSTPSTSDSPSTQSSTTSDLTTPTTTPGTLLGPSGVVTPSSTPTPTTTTVKPVETPNVNTPAANTPDVNTPTAPPVTSTTPGNALESILSSVLPPLNLTDLLPTPTPSVSTIQTPTELPPTSTAPPITSTVVTPTDPGTVPVTTPEPTSSPFQNGTETSTAPPLTSTLPPITSTANVTTPDVPPPPTTLPAGNGTAVDSVTPPPITSTSMPYTVPSSLPAQTGTPTISSVPPEGTTSLPSGLPQAITPANSDPVPPDSQIVHFVFNYKQSYDFVSTNSYAASTIQEALPAAIACYSGGNQNDYQFQQLTPLDTRPQLGYISTVANIAIPKTLVSSLRMDVSIPGSSFYQCRYDILREFTTYVNPTFDIVGVLDSSSTSGSSGGGSGGSGGSTGNNAGSGSGDGSPFGSSSSSGQSSSQQGMTAGLAIGGVFLASAYGATMFVIARRYKKKKQSHQRTSSVTSPSLPSEMRFTGNPTFMGGALLSRDFSAYGAISPGGRDSHGSGRSGLAGSGRTAFISAPVAAENSLGWS